MHGSNAQTTILSDLPKNYKKIEIVLGAVRYVDDTKKYYYPYLDTVTFYPQTSKSGGVYAYKTSNSEDGQKIDWQVDLTRDSNQVYAYTWNTAGLWKGIYIRAIYGYK